MQTLEIVSPCYNDFESLKELLVQIDACLEEKKLDLDVRYLIIDNGSAVEFADALFAGYQGPNKIRIFRLGINVGYNGAILFGLKKSTADFVAVIDSDLEDPPLALVEMMARLKDSDADYIFGKRVKRAVSLRLRLLYFTFYKLLAAVSDNQIPQDAGEFAIYSRKVVDRLKLFNPQDNFVRGLRVIVSLNYLEFPYSRQKRFKGETKFKFFHSVDLAIDGFLFNTKKPLRAFTVFGTVLFFISGFLLLLNSVSKILNGTFALNIPYVLPEGLTQTSVILYLLLLSLFVMLCIIGEYVLKIFIITRQRPAYFIEAVYEHDPK